MSKNRSNTILSLSILLVLAVIFAGYTFYWFKAAEFAQQAYVSKISEIVSGTDVTPPRISGFPGKMVLTQENETIENFDGALSINDLQISSWPFPNTPVEIKTGRIALGSPRWSQGFSFDSFYIRATPTDKLVSIHDSALNQGTFRLQATGTVDLSNPDFIQPDLLVNLGNPKLFLAHLKRAGFVDARAGQLVAAALSSLRNPETGDTEVPIYTKGSMLHIGPLPIADLAVVTPPSQRGISRPPQRSRIEPDIEMTHPQELPSNQKLPAPSSLQDNLETDIKDVRPEPLDSPATPE